jgi:uncharacterized membrane protein YvbJ
MKFCSNCGGKLETDAKFCSECGFSLQTTFTQVPDHVKTSEVKNSSASPNTKTEESEYSKPLIYGVIAAAALIVVVIVVHLAGGSGGSSSSNCTSQYGPANPTDLNSIADFQDGKGGVWRTVCNP